MKKFFGFGMGGVKIPKLSDYWSKDEVIGHPFPRTVMLRNRFDVTVLPILHFSEDDEGNKSNRFHRVRKLMDDLNVFFGNIILQMKIFA